MGRGGRNLALAVPQSLQGRVFRHQQDVFWQQVDGATRNIIEARCKDWEVMPHPFMVALSGELLTTDWQPGKRTLLVQVVIAAFPPAPEPVRVNIGLNKTPLARINAEAG